MKEESINSLKQLINSLERNVEIMKDSIKDSDKKKFNELKEESLAINKKIDNLIQ